jgi:polysaccharide pyruvyl transferase WcaK-like protein
MHRRTPLAVFGLFGSPNLGNEATLAAFLFNMRQRAPHRAYVCIAPATHSVEQVHGTPRLPMDPLPIARLCWRIRPRSLRASLTAAGTLMTESHRRRRAIDMLRGAKALLVPGTGIVDDFGQGPLDMPLHLDRWTHAAAMVGASIAFVSIGAAKVESAISRHLFCRALKRARYCSVRDVASAEVARRLGISRTLPIAPDLAFSLPETLRSHDPIAWPPKTVGVGLMGYHGWNAPADEGREIYHRYVDKMVILIRWLLSRGMTVRLLIGDTRADQGVRSDVLKALAGCGRALEAHLVAVEISDYLSLIEEIKRCDIILATRFHNVLLSIWLGRPAISISYDEKNDALMNDVGMARYCHPIESLDVAAVRSSVEEMTATANPPVDPLHAYSQRARTALLTQYDELATTLDL